VFSITANLGCSTCTAAPRQTGNPVTAAILEFQSVRHVGKIAGRECKNPQTAEILSSQGKIRNVGSC